MLNGEEGVQKEGERRRFERMAGKAYGIWNICQWYGLLQARTVDEPSCWGGWQWNGLVGLSEVWMPKWSACQRRKRSYEDTSEVEKRLEEKKAKGRERQCKASSDLDNREERSTMCGWKKRL